MYNRETLAEIDSTCQGRSLRWRLKSCMYLGNRFVVIVAVGTAEYEMFFSFILVHLLQPNYHKKLMQNILFRKKVETVVMVFKLSVDEKS